MDIALAVAQGRHPDGHRVKAEIEIFAETPRLNGAAKIDVGGGHHPHIGLLHLGRADLDEFTRLEHAQQAGLGGQRQLGHLVQEQGAAVGLFEITLAGLCGAGKGPFLVTEQLGIYGPLRYCAAVYRQVYIMFAGAVEMDNLGYELLAHAALAGDQHRQVGLGHLEGNAYGIVQRGRISYNAESLFYRLVIHSCEFTIFSSLVFYNCYICPKYGY